MSKFVSHIGTAVPLDMSNVDTDAIIPKQFLQKVTKSGFGKHLFNDWRYLDDGSCTLNKNFILNSPLYHNSTILLSRENFGCGSSREHAVWALLDYGFKVILASSFADIFYSNSIKNGLLPVVLSKKVINELFKTILKDPNTRIVIDLLNNKVLVHDQHYNFEIDSVYKYCILHGLDDIDLTMKCIKKIECYEHNIPRFFTSF
ncbi:MAG: 3-isopropylmalate dehydratase small subunit [Buchnera aphidicola (Meitanaphis flavogallis)]